jgi:nucleotide-binding universal stress UspA family protein
MKVILVPVADRPECKLAMDAAFGLGDKFGGSVIGCHLRPHRFESAAKNPRSFLGFRKSESLAHGMSEDQIDLKSKAARELFLSQATAAGFKTVKHPTLGAARVAQWVEMVGSLDKLFGIAGPTSDVCVVSRPKQTSKGPGSDFMLAALLETGKPVLVLPQTPVPTIGKHIMIAWNQSVEAARAVSASMPLLQLAEAVHIVTGGSESRPGPKSTALVNYLKYWGVKASRKRTKGADVSAEIFDEYRKSGSDLIVMGAYSRGRFRERVFGGVTEDLLFRSAPPILTLHS